MQLFNWINARKLVGELNVFRNICNNSLFFVILITTLVIQVCMIQFGGKALQTQPLNARQNLFCVLFGAFELIWALVVKSLPLKCFWCTQQQRYEPEADELSNNTQNSLVKSLRRSSSLKRPETP